MVFRSTNIGDSFYLIKSFQKSQIDSQYIFKSLHGIVDNVYDLKKTEEDTFNDLKRINEATQNMYNNEIQDIQYIYDKSRKDLFNMQTSLSGLQQDLEKKEKQQVSMNGDLNHKQRESQQIDKDSEQIIDNLNNLVKNINGIVSEIKLEEPNKIKIDKYRANFESYLKDTSIPSKFNLQTKIQNISSIQSNFNLNNDKNSKDQLIQKYSEIQSVTQRENDGKLALIKSNKQTSKVEMEDSQNNLQKIQNVIGKIMADIKVLEEDIDLQQEKENIFQGELELLQKSKPAQIQFLEVEKNLYKDRIMELEDTLGLMRECNDFMNNNKSLVSNISDEKEQQNTTQQSQMNYQNSAKNNRFLQ